MLSCRRSLEFPARVTGPAKENGGPAIAGPPLRTSTAQAQNTGVHLLNSQMYPLQPQSASFTHSTAR